MRRHWWGRPQRDVCIVWSGPAPVGRPVDLPGCTHRASWRTVGQVQLCVYLSLRALWESYAPSNGRQLSLRAFCHTAPSTRAGCARYWASWGNQKSPAASAWGTTHLTGEPTQALLTFDPLRNPEHPEEVFYKVEIAIFAQFIAVCRRSK